MAYQLIPSAETQGQPASPKSTSCVFGTLRGRRHWKTWGWREQLFWWNWWGTEEFMVHLARAVKDAQTEKKHCYHCSSPEHFIHNCPLMKTLREKPQLNGKEGTASKEGAQPGPLWQQLPCQRISRQRFPRHKAIPTDSHLESRPLSTLAWGQKCS